MEGSKYYTDDCYFWLMLSVVIILHEKINFCTQISKSHLFHTFQTFLILFYKTHLKTLLIQMMLLITIFSIAQTDAAQLFNQSEHCDFIKDLRLSKSKVAFAQPFSNFSKVSIFLKKLTSFFEKASKK